MTKEQLDQTFQEIGKAVINLYTICCESIPKSIVIAGLTGGLAACAAEANLPRDRLIAALNSAFDGLEEDEPQE